MRRWMLAVGLILGGAVAGCASSTQLENEARVHSLRADAAAHGRDYNTAYKEQEKARELHNDAVQKAYKEGRPDVYVPADVPAPTTP